MKISAKDPDTGETGVVEVDPGPLHEWFLLARSVITQVAEHVAGTPHLERPPASHAGEARQFREIIDALLGAIELQREQVEQLTKKVRLLETGIAARDIAWQKTFDACWARIKNHDDSEGRQPRMDALLLLSNELQRQMPGAVKMVADAREHESCEEKIRELGSAIFPRMHDGSE